MAISMLLHVTFAQWSFKWQGEFQAYRMFYRSNMLWNSCQQSSVTSVLS